MPTLTIFAGINGAGKSTLYKQLCSTFNSNLGTRICLDEILTDFGGDWNNTNHQIQSAKIAIEQMEQCLKNKQSFNWETTIISNNTLEKIKLAKSFGYKVNLYFIAINDVNLALRRIEKRVAKGGHGVDTQFVKGVYKHQFKNIKNVLVLLDNAVFYDNTTTPKIAGFYSNKTLSFYEQNSWIKNCLQDSNKNKLQINYEK